MARAAYDAFAVCDIDLLTATELLEIGDEVDTLTRQAPTQSHRVLARLQVETTAKALGAKSWRDVLTTRWRISTAEAGRRLALAALLGPRRSLTGEPLEPALPATAAAQAHGLITAEHVDIIRKSMTKIPGFVDAATRTQIEVDWARLAVKVGPKELLDGIELRLFLLDQDGPEPDDTERKRKRGFSIGRQGRDGTSQATACLTPEARATWEPILAKYAAPGMCNPEDPEPCTSGTPSQAQIDNDHRSLAQRQHDAMIVVGRIALMSGELGQLNGLPVSIIIRTTLQDLESRAGIAVTGGGTKMPVKDVLRLAGHSNLFLAVFDKATGSAMDLFRARRVASLAQRIMLIGREGGCTKPGCTVGPYGCQVHHATADWADDGQTNVDDMGLACGPDNRMVGKDGGWTTQMSDKHDVEWIPPPHLDTGQSRINYHHTPERLLGLSDDDTPGPQPAQPDPPASPEAAHDCDPQPVGDDNPETRADNTTGDDNTEDSAPESFDPWADVTRTDSVSASPLREPDPDEDRDPAEPFDPWAPEDTEPGEPTPSDDYTAQCRAPEPQPGEPPEPESFDSVISDIPDHPMVADRPVEPTAPDHHTAESESPPPEDIPDEPAASEPSSLWADASTEPGGPAPPDDEVA